MWGANQRAQVGQQVRGAIALLTVFALAVGGLAASVAGGVQAAPAAQLGPIESFTGTVVPGTIVPAGASVRFNVERPAKSNPAELEQLIVESVQVSLVVPNEILSITGNYDPVAKIFKAAAMTSLGNASPAPSSRSGSSGGGGGDDNDNGSSDDDDSDSDDNDNGGDDDDDDSDADDNDNFDFEDEDNDNGDARDEDNDNN